MTDSPVLTVAEAADYLRISEASLYRRIKDGTIPAVKFGRTTRIAKRELDQLLGILEDVAS